MQRSADLDDLDLLEVVDPEMVNQDKEDGEDGLAPALYCVPQNRSHSRLSKTEAYRVRTILFLSIFLCGFCVTSSQFLPPKVVLSSSNVAGYLPMTPGVDNSVSKMPSLLECPSILVFADADLCFWTSCRPFGPLALG